MSARRRAERTGGGAPRALGGGWGVARTPRTPGGGWAGGFRAPASGGWASGFRAPSGGLARRFAVGWSGAFLGVLAERGGEVVHCEAVGAKEVGGA